MNDHGNQITGRIKCYGQKLWNPFETNRCPVGNRLSSFSIGTGQPGYNLAKFAGLVRSIHNLFVR